MVSDYELKVFYASERRLLQMLVMNYTIEPILAVLTIALWLFFENAGHGSVIHFALKNGDNRTLVATLTIEAQIILAHLRDPTSAAPHKSVEWTAKLLKRAFTIEEFIYRRSEIILWINDTVANSLSRAFEDLYEMPAVGLGYLTALVPLTPEKPPMNLIGTHRNLGTELFPNAISGCPFPWTTLSGDLVKPFIKPSFFGEPLITNKEIQQQPGVFTTVPIGVHSMSCSPTNQPLTMVHPMYTTSINHDQARSSHSSSLSMQPTVMPDALVGFVPTYWEEVMFSPYRCEGAVDVIHQVPVGHFPNMLSPFRVVSAGGYEMQEMELFDASAYYGSEQFDDDSYSGTDGSDSDMVGDGRTLFVTFSRGYPLEAQELRDYFSSVYGDVVERVMVQRTKGTRPLFAKLILTSAEALSAVLNGQSKVKMVIQGRDAWARLYKRKKRSQPSRVIRRELLRRH